MSAIDASIPLALPDEERVVWARRAIPDAQALLTSGAQATLPLMYECAWFGTAALSDRGSFALVDPALELSAYVGDDLRLTNDDGQSLIVYVVGSQAMGVPVAITRRSFLALAPLYRDTVRVRIEVLA